MFHEKEFPKKLWVDSLHKVQVLWFLFKPDSLQKLCKIKLHLRHGLVLNILYNFFKIIWLFMLLTCTLV